MVAGLENSVKTYLLPAPEHLDFRDRWISHSAARRSPIPRPCCVSRKSEFGHDINQLYGVTSKVGGQMADQDMRGWALKGAEQRLLEMAQEAKAIYTAFPELREGGLVGNGRRPGRPRREETAPATEGPRRRRRRKMSKEARRKISEAQKARWAKQNGQSSDSSPSPTRSATPAQAGKKKRTMSAAARRTIGAAQRKRWRAQKAARKASSRTRTSK